MAGWGPGGWLRARWLVEGQVAGWGPDGWLLDAEHTKGITLLRKSFFRNSFYSTSNTSHGLPNISFSNTKAYRISCEQNMVSTPTVALARKLWGRASRFTSANCSSFCSTTKHPETWTKSKYMYSNQHTKVYIGKWKSPTLVSYNHW